MVYFSHQSWKKASPTDQDVLQNVYGFPLPPSDQVMANYGSKESRLKIGVKLFKQFKKSKECPVDITQEIILEKAKEDYEKRKNTLRVKDTEARSQAILHPLRAKGKRVKKSRRAGRSRALRRQPSSRVRRCVGGSLGGVDCSGVVCSLQ